MHDSGGEMFCLDTSRCSPITAQGSLTTTGSTLKECAAVGPMKSGGREGGKGGRKGRWGGGGRRTGWA